MAKPHGVGALRNKQAEPAGTLRQLEQRLAAADAQCLVCPGECLRLIYDELREATQPVTTRELAERIMRLKGTRPHWPGNRG